MRFSPGNTDSSSPVRGLPNGPDGNPLLRQELRAFSKNKALFDLYLLGLWAWQNVPQNQDLSWFQVCGIHGLPYEKWPQQDPLLDGLKKANNTGFCTHTSIIFLTWHRPYLALFESTLYEAMKYVAEQATEEEGRQSYMDALESFRMPYWDWALPATKDTPAFPAEAADSDKVKLPMPTKMKEAYDLNTDETLVEIYNPLFCYPFATGTLEDFKIGDQPTTQRWYNPEEELTPEKRKANLTKHLHHYSQEWRETLGEIPVERNLRERVVYLLQSYTNFAQVSHNKWDSRQVVKLYPHEDPEGPGKGFGSIEDVHNAIHVGCGGGGADFTGHMSDSSISAFDPIFWLHHTNIDRLFTIWQALHDDPDVPETYVTKQLSVRNGTTWVTPVGGYQDGQTLLAPFYETENKFWNSTGVRSADTFGYAYPETQHWNFKTKSEYRDDVTMQLTALYPNGSLANTIRAAKAGNKATAATLQKRAAILANIVKQPSVPNNTAALLNVVHQRAVTAGSAIAEPVKDILTALSDHEPQPLPIYEIPSDRAIPLLAKNDTYLEWLVNITAQKHVMNGRYSVHIFLDSVDEVNTNLYAVAPNHVGTFFPLGQSANTGCGKCQVDQANHTQISGQIPLTVALAERYLAGLVDSLEPAHVVPYLQRNLHWRVLDSNGSPLDDRSQLADLVVGVISNEVRLPEREGDLPRYSPDITYYPEITTRPTGEGRGEGTGMTRDNLFSSTTVAA